MALTNAKLTCLVELLDLSACEPSMSSTNICKEYTFLSSKHNFMLAVLGFSHGNDVATFLTQVFAEKDLTIRNTHQVKEATKLTTE